VTSCAWVDDGAALVPTRNSTAVCIVIAGVGDRLTCIKLAAINKQFRGRSDEPFADASPQALSGGSSNKRTPA